MAERLSQIYGERSANLECKQDLLNGVIRLTTDNKALGVELYNGR